MKLFIINVSDERKKTLSDHLEVRDINKKLDVRWSGEYKNNHPFVTWLKLTHAKHMHVNSISNHLNWFNSLEYGCDDSHFMIACDDVVFPEDWEGRIQKLKPLPANNISEGVCYHVPYTNDYTVTGNFGGMECIIFQGNFAKFILGNIDFEQCLDIVIGAMMVYNGLQLAITPICHQTSILVDKPTTGSSEYKTNWITYTNTYKPSGLSFKNLKCQFHEFMTKKWFAEALFFRNFNRHIDIWNMEYINTKYSLKK